MPARQGRDRAGTIPAGMSGQDLRDQLTANFISLIASEFITWPPIRLVA